MILRFRSKNGIGRVECSEMEAFGEVVKKWLNTTNISIAVDTIAISNSNAPAVKTSLADISTKSLHTLGLKHGDMLTITYQESTNKPEATANVNDLSAMNTSIKFPSTADILPVDLELEKEDGLIPRQKSRLCRHGERGMCEYCSPLPPWDRTFKEENSIKHISFHAHVKELNEHTNKKTSGSSYIPPLSQPVFQINKHCPSPHEPWPRGICSKCQPSAISLQVQEFRMVDHVEFQKGDLINEFIESWRSTGMQRFGYLYGTYQRYKNTPLGIKAAVEAIWEPPQDDEQDGLSMDMQLIEKELEHVDALATQMGLLRVGMIFTDLTDSGNGDGTVFCKRHKDSFFLSSVEVVMAAKHQSKNPNVTRFSQQGIFSSKFVTCVISGNLKGEIDIAAYQVSTDAEALVTADMISPSTHPSLAYINETNDKRYVPEIFYMRKNDYNITVKENAKPAFPVDYLIVSLTHGFPLEPLESQPLFQTNSGFPWCNRQAMGYSQDYYELRRYLLSAATSNDLNVLQKKLSNFHMLLYIHSLQVFSPDEWRLLIKAATSVDSDGQEAIIQLTSSSGWHTLLMILQESV